MSNLDTVIDFGSKNLRLGVFNESSEIIYSSNIKTSEVLESENLDNSLYNLIGVVPPVNTKLNLSLFRSFFKAIFLNSFLI